MISTSVGAPMRVRCPCSIQSITPAMATTAKTSSFDTIGAPIELGLRPCLTLFAPGGKWPPSDIASERPACRSDGRSLRMRQEGNQGVDDDRNRQDREYPRQGD